MSILDKITINNSEYHLENKHTDTDSDFYEQIQENIFKELNKLRLNPQSYIPLIKEQMGNFKGNILLRKNNQLPIETIEGAKAYEEAVNFLMFQQPVKELKFDKNLSKAALDLIKDIGPKGRVTHQDSLGNNLSERIERYCEWDYCANECINLCSKTPQEILISLLVDDGVSERSDRNALFQPIYEYIGIGCGSHKSYQIMTVIVFVGGVRPKGTLFYQTKDKKILPEKKIVRNINQNLRKNTTNVYQINDPYAPDNTIGLRLVKTQKSFNGKQILITKKIYKLDDGTEHVVELEYY